MQTDGLLRRTRAEAVVTAWENSMEWIVLAVVLGAGYWWWSKRGGPGGPFGGGKGGDHK
jgi:hypothetical protein